MGARGDDGCLYADDTIVGFQYPTDADRVLENLRERLAKFGLELHPDKTRRIEFGRFAEENRKRRGEGKPETFDFLGFQHISGKNSLGRFTVRRTTIRKRMRAKLRELKQELRRRMHDPVHSVVRGYFNYYAVPGNLVSLAVFRNRLLGLWWAKPSSPEPATPPFVRPRVMRPTPPQLGTAPPRLRNSKLHTKWCNG